MAPCDVIFPVVNPLVVGEGGGGAVLRRNVNHGVSKDATSLGKRHRLPRAIECLILILFEAETRSKKTEGFPRWRHERART